MSANKFNWRKYYALKQQYDKDIGCGIPNKPGIYLWTRKEGDITYWYVGQAKNLYNRRFDYYKIRKGLDFPKRHFEASLKKHKDWLFSILHYEINYTQDELNELEKQEIKNYLAKPNFITRNVLTGAGEGAKRLDEGVIHSNYKRINRLYEALEKKIGKYTTQLNIEANKAFVKISIKKTKNGSNNKISEKAYYDLLKILDIKI